MRARCTREAILVRAFGPDGAGRTGPIAGRGGEADGTREGFPGLHQFLASPTWRKNEARCNTRVSVAAFALR